MRDCTAHRGVSIAFDPTYHPICPLCSPAQDSPLPLNPILRELREAINELDSAAGAAAHAESEIESAKSAITHELAKLGFDVLARE